LIKKELRLESSVGVNIQQINQLGGYTRSESILEYNGFKLNFGGQKFDLVSIIAVLHHFYPQYIDSFLINLSNCARYVYVEDNDFTAESIPYIEIQHYIFETHILPGNKTFINYITQEFVTRKFLQYGFKIIHFTANQNFNKFKKYSVLFKNSHF
jgi:hypothetical protein